MQPSSLIFLLVIAIWAAYLVQHWLRRREHLSTARTMDRFSQSMRILDRTKAGRASAPGSVSTTGSMPLHRRSGRVSVAEVAGGATMAVKVPDVKVSEVGVPEVTKSNGGLPNVAVPNVAIPDQARADGASPRTSRLSSRSTLAGRPKLPARLKLPVGSRGAARPKPAALPKLPARTVVGGVFVAAVGLTLAGAVLAAAGAVGWPLPGMTAVVGIASFVGLSRIAAKQTRQETQQHASTSQRPRSGRTPTVRPRAEAAAAARSASVAGRPAPADARPAPADARPARAARAAGRRAAAPGRPAPAAQTPAAAPAPAKRARRAEVFDVAEHEATSARPSAKASPPEQVPGGWSPVPVPPPTYTLKAKAVYPTPLDDIDEDDVTSPYAAVDAGGRRRVSG